ncbi:hypothetical protein JTB14_010378 [Gonioctena quinquepunctata]|nr:hypothetical protein JTB14_010378 [Gonioctena quinquepunctata]
MGSQIVFFLLVGLVYASSNPGWMENNEYIYRVSGRTLAGLQGSSDQYSGILLKAHLRLQPKSDGKLYALLSEPKYSNVYSRLAEGWNTHIPDSNLNWKPLSLSSKPFQIVMEDGYITDLIVSRNVPNWEANMIKGIVSQFQLNTQAKHSDDSLLRLDEPSYDVFVCMEDTISGNTETLYEIRPLPDYELDNREYESRYLDLKGDGDIIEVVKHKNYTNHVELPLYLYGFGRMANWWRAEKLMGANQLGNFFVRDTTSRALLTGNLRKYTVQSSVTVNKVLVSPTLTDQKIGSVISALNVTLESVKSQFEEIEDISSPLKLGNLVYTYDRPHSQSNLVREKTPYEEKGARRMDDLESNYRTTNMARSRRSLENSSEEVDHVYKGHLQDKPSLTQAPESPFLPYTTGIKGKTLKENVNILSSVQELSKRMLDDNFDHENTLDRFSTMTSLIRLMNADEIKTVINAVYTNAEQGRKLAIWTTFRDALAESGTGPAFLAIQNCIETKKLGDEEASQVLSTMAKAVREPTLQYMKAYFELVKKLQVQSRWPLNDTALMTFTDLLSRVYVDVHHSKIQYPVKTFGDFNSEEGEKLIMEEVIPYLTTQLNGAITQAETRKIHTHIRAMGNLGHPKILSAYKPYLEGRKQASQFQRLLMILSMERLMNLYPSKVIPVLFRVYQNPGESQEVRVAAVFHLMRSPLPVQTLKIMASYTHKDPHESVNAAVKSSILALAESKDHLLNYAAKAAKPLLTEKRYGVQYGAQYLRTYFIEEMKKSFDETLQLWGSENGVLPKGFRYMLQEDLDGLRSKLINIQAFVSNLEELFHVGAQQFELYQSYEKQQMEQYEEQKQYPWSSQKINNLFNIKATEREQLEGHLYLKFGSLHRMFSFDNNTLRDMPLAVQEMEKKLNKGLKVNFVKLFNNRDMVVSLPTEMGLPFLFTHETPMMIKVQGKLTAVSTPKLSQAGKMYIPDEIQVNSDVSITYTSKLQSRLIVTTPFDSHQFVAGFDRHLQMTMPVQGKMNIDVKKMELRLEMELKGSQKKMNLFHYKSWPYISKTEVTNLEPLSNQPNTMIVKPKSLPRFEKIIGKRETGMAFHVEVEHERKFVDVLLLSRLFKHGNLLSGLEALWDDDTIQYSKIEVSYLPQKSNLNKAIVRLGYQNKYMTEGEPEISSKWRLDETEDSLKRQQKLIERVSAEIKNVRSRSVDAALEFQGRNNMKYVFTGAYSKSNIDALSRVMFSLKRISDSQDLKSYEAHFTSKSNIPNTNGLDLEYSLKAEPLANIDMELEFGLSDETLSKVDVEMKYGRSKERTQYLKELSMYQKCKQEMREGDYQLPACLNMTIDSNEMDRVNMTIRYENLKPELEEALRTLYEALRFNFLPSLELHRQQSSLKSNEILMQARFHPDLKFVNVSVLNQLEESIVRNIWVSELARRTFVSHPVFHLRSRLTSYLTSRFRLSCVVDKTRVNTFSNRTYLADISKHWTVMLHYIPKEARHQDQQTVATQLQSQIENYAVLVLDIEMSPSQQSSSLLKARVTVNGQEIQVTEKESHDVNDGFIQIYALPNGEVKVEVLNAFYILYDGYRARLTITDNKFRDSTRGLCGQSNYHKYEDFLTSENCIARDWMKFIKGYEVEGRDGTQIRVDLGQKSEQCVEIHVPLYVNVIDSDNELDNFAFTMSRHPLSGKCTLFKTKYVEQNGEICYTILLLPFCSNQCQSDGYVTKNVPVHCLPKSTVTEHWKSQIDAGHSLDFSSKKEHKSLPMAVPRSCSK